MTLLVIRHGESEADILFMRAEQILISPNAA